MVQVRERIRETPSILPRREPETPLQAWRSSRRIGGALLALQGAGWLASRLNQRSVTPTRLGGTLGTLAGDLGRGLVAGAVGTLAITVAAAAHQEIKRRLKPDQAEPEPRETFLQALIRPWLFSADALGKVLGGVTPQDEAAKRRLAWAAHLSYGSSWGLSLTALSRTGIRGPAAMGALLGGVLGAEMLIMPRAGFFPPVGDWGTEAVVSSTYQHAIYAIAAGLTFDLLER